MSPRHTLADCYLVDPTARLRVWTVTVQPVNPDDGGGIYAPRVRVPAYTAAEAAQVAATMSGLPREEWAAYFFVPRLALWTGGGWESDLSHEEGTP